MGAGKAGNFGNTYGSSLDAVSNFLAMASFVPGADTVTNFLSIPVDLARGDFLSAGLDVLGMIPVLGEVADLAKVANKVDNIADTAKVVKKTSNITKNVKVISPSKLTQTQKLTLSKKQYNNLVESIKKNGMIETIKYVEHNGTKYVVDGHHRLRVAKELQLDKVPVEKVSLPYKGYKTINDFFWFD